MTQNWPDEILRHPTRFCVSRKSLPVKGVTQMTQMTQKYPLHLVLVRAPRRNCVARGDRNATIGGRDADRDADHSERAHVSRCLLRA